MRKRLGIRTLHNGMILSTLSIGSHGFAFGFPERPRTNGDVSLAYKPMINPLITNVRLLSQQSSKHTASDYKRNAKLKSIHDNKKHRSCKTKCQVCHDKLPLSQGVDGMGPSFYLPTKGKLHIFQMKNDHQTQELLILTVSTNHQYQLKRIM